jgi:hypothetical protein
LPCYLPGTSSLLRKEEDTCAARLATSLSVMMILRVVRVFFGHACNDAMLLKPRMLAPT